jgi:hypothetical protein
MDGLRVKRFCYNTEALGLVAKLQYSFSFNVKLFNDYELIIVSHNPENVLNRSASL